MQKHERIKAVIYSGTKPIKAIIVRRGKDYKITIPKSAYELCDQFAAGFAWKSAGNQLYDILIKNLYNL